MSRKQIHISCPCCEARMEVDVLTQKVISWRRPEELDPSGKPKVTEADWDAANSRVSGRGSAAEDKFDQFLGREQTRGKDLDALFDDMKKRSKDPDPE